MVRMPITFNTLRMVFVHAWTIGDASSCLFNQCLHQFYLVCSMSSGIITPPSWTLLSDVLPMRSHCGASS
jgi:hypothetical protein